MISQITPVLQGIEQPDGQTIANARGFTDNDDNGALNVEMGDDWSGEEEVYVPNMYYAVSLAANTTYTIDLNGSVSEYPAVRFTDENNQLQGTAMIIDDMDYPPTVTPASFTTPNTAGIYYIHVAYSNEWTTIPLLVAPRPGEYSRATKHLWDTVQGQMDTYGLVKARTTGTPPASFVLPLTSSLTPSVNTKSVEVTTEGTVSFSNGTAVIENGSIKVKVDNYRGSNFTYAFAFNQTSSGSPILSRFIAGDNSLLRFKLYSGSGSTENIGTQVGVGFEDEKKENVFLFNPKALSNSAWHTYIVSFDFDKREVRASIDGKINGTFIISYPQVDSRVNFSYNSTNVGLRPFLLENANGYFTVCDTWGGNCSGLAKNVKIWDFAFDYSQMMVESAKLLS